MESGSSMQPTAVTPTPSDCIDCNLPDPNYPSAVVTIMFCAMVVTIVIDLIGNSMVILAVSKNKKLRNTGNIFVVSLSVADMLAAVYPYPLMLHAMAAGGWDLGHVQCQLVCFINGLSVVGSIFNIVAIAINRYCYICHSLKYERIFSPRKSFIYLAVVWFMTLLAVVPNMFVGKIRYDPRVYTCTFSYLNNSAFGITVVSIHFVLPLLIVGFCYMRIWNRVLAVRAQAAQHPDNQLAELRNFLTMFIIFVLFAACWAPINVLTVLVAVSSKELIVKIPSWVYLVAYFLAYFNSCVNAIVYGFLNENFRREYWAVFHALRHPILFLSGFFTDCREGREARALARARARARDQAREQAREQALSLTGPVVEELAMSVRNVPLPGDCSAGQVEQPSASPRSTSSVFCKSISTSALTHSKTTSATLFSKPASAHSSSDTVHFQPTSVHFKRGSVHFTTTSCSPKSIISTVSTTDSLFSTSTSHSLPVTPVHAKFAITYPESSSYFSDDSGAYCSPVTSPTHCEYDVPYLPGPSCSLVTGSPDSVVSPTEVEPMAAGGLSGPTYQEQREVVVLDVEVRSEELDL